MKVTRDPHCQPITQVVINQVLHVVSAWQSHPNHALNSHTGSFKLFTATEPQ